MDANTRTEELLRRAADKLQDYCAGINGDMNDSLAMEIYDFLDGEPERIGERLVGLLGLRVKEGKVLTGVGDKTMKGLTAAVKDVLEGR